MAKGSCYAGKALLLLQYKVRPTEHAQQEPTPESHIKNSQIIAYFLE